MAGFTFLSLFPKYSTNSYATFVFVFGCPAASLPWARDPSQATVVVANYDVAVAEMDPLTPAPGWGLHL